MRNAVEHNITRQMSFQGEPESLPLPGSQVKLSQDKDPLGIPRPVLHYEVSEYTKRAFIHVGKILEQVLERMGADPRAIRKTIIGRPAAAKFGEKLEELEGFILSSDDMEKLNARQLPVSLKNVLQRIVDFPLDDLANQIEIVPEETDGYRDWLIIVYPDKDAQTYTNAYMLVPQGGDPLTCVLCSAEVHEYGGAGHIVGTFRMGDHPTDSVVDKDCRSHDHKNLFLQGSGLFPAIATANPTLTIMALALRAADTIANELIVHG